MPTEDPDQDGVCNLAEFALGTDPLIKSELPKAIEEGGFLLPLEAMLLGARNVECRLSLWAGGESR